MSVSRQTRIGAWLLVLTAALVATGCLLWVAGFVGWAELLVVLASGTAGAGIVLFVEDR